MRRSSVELEKLRRSGMLVYRILQDLKNMVAEGITRLDLPNDHLQYAITWFSLAIALIVIYVLYHRGDLTQRSGQS